ncbi:MAG: hypothetical protein KF833_02185 [Verrucomicrobiae bacterium]|nr:hypothetical protein [Verrucomicrobiae bacterium]
MQQCFGERPDSCAAEVARSLGLLGYCLAALGRTSEAVAAVEEALRLVLPHVERDPEAHGDLVEVLTRHYMKWAASIGHAGDQSLLGRGGG